MSKFSSFVGGFGTGLATMNQLTDRKRRMAREDQQYAREEAKYQKENAYQNDREAAGQLAQTGSTGIQGIGVQQDAQLAQQNASFANDTGQVGVGLGAKPMDESTFTNAKPTGDYFGAMARVAAKHGRPEDVARFTQASEAEKVRMRKEEMSRMNKAVFERMKNGEIDQTQAVFELGGIKAQYGDDPMATLIASKEFGDKAKTENYSGGVRVWMSGGSADDVMKEFNKTGDMKLKSARFEEGESFIPGEKQSVLVGISENGKEVRIPQQQAIMFLAKDKDMMSFMESRRKQQAAAEAEDRKDEREARREDGRDRRTAQIIAGQNWRDANGSGGGSGSGGKQKDDSLSDSDMQRLFPGSPTNKFVGGKLTQEPGIDRTEYNRFATWAANNDMPVSVNSHSKWIASKKPAGASRPQGSAKPFNVNEFMRK